MQDKNKSATSNKEQEKENKNIDAAHKAADKDIEQDPDIKTGPEPGDNLDEGELARFEGEE